MWLIFGLDEFIHKLKNLSKIWPTMSNFVNFLAKKWQTSTIMTTAVLPVPKEINYLKLKRAPNHKKKTICMTLKFKK